MNNCVVLSAFVALSCIGFAMPVTAQQNPSVPAGRMRPQPYATYPSASEIASSPLYFGNLDRNHDGLLSRSEIPKALRDLSAHFDQYDVDQNHRIDSSEYADFMQNTAYGNCHGSSWMMCPINNPYAVAETP